MIKILFLIHDLGQGGAEKVLVNLVNNMDKTKFDITVTALFGGGVNEQFLDSSIHYHTVWKKMIPANSKWMKLMSPEQLHAFCVKEHYDIEVSYLEGPAARVISGCKDSKTKLVSWIHVEQHSMERLAAAFRSSQEAIACYNRFDRTICVSDFVKKDFTGILNFEKPCEVLYNTVETVKILSQSTDPVDGIANDKSFRMISVASLKESKGIDRLINIVAKLKAENYNCRLYILGKGPMRETLEKQVSDLKLGDNVVFLGYDTNPYKYVAKADLFVCASYAEGFSTAATEALIVGTPVCTVEVSGMKEMLGENNEYGVVTENDDQALYVGIKSFLDSPEQLAFYKEKAKERGKYFSTENTVRAVEDMLVNIKAENESNIDYSVIIRTTGKAREKYQRLLDSISKLEPQPREIIVVLPEGYSLPDERLGNERFCFSPKGMVVQRMEGIHQCHTRYALICDDDVAFSADFVKLLYEPLKAGLGSFSIAPLYPFLPPKGFNATLCAIMGSASPTIFHRDRFISVLKSSGYSYNRRLRNGQYYETQSAPWTCFFADMEAFPKLNFEEEKWLDFHNYSSLDDQTMFYKAWLMGMKTIAVPDAHYDHLDARTSFINNRPNVSFSKVFNRFVFWHRFIYSQETTIIGKIWSKLCFIYSQTMTRIYERLCYLRHKLSKEDLRIIKEARAAARDYINSKEYQMMEKIR